MERGDERDHLGGLSRLTLEVIASTVEDAIEAARGGAHRLEIVRDLARGGLTPAVDLVRQIQDEVPLPLRVMVRDSDGFACASEGERRALEDRAGAFGALGVDGIVVGWTRDGAIDEDTLGRVLEAGLPMRATFHRALDTLADPEAAFRVLLRYPQIDRVLTSAGTGPWRSRCATLARYAGWAAPRIVILPGGEIDEAAIRGLAQCECVSELHIGRAARIGGRVDGAVSAAAVRQLRLAAGC